MMTLQQRANEKLNNWKPETASLLRALLKAGFALVRGDNGEDEFTFDGKLAPFIDELTACDEARLFVRNPEGKVRWIYLVFGNSPGELASDYTVDPLLDAVTEAHYAKWEGRKQPTQTAAEAYPHIYGPTAIAEKEAAYAKRQAEQEAHIAKLEGSVK